MILNAVNSRTMKTLTGSAFIDDWGNIQITVYVDSNVRFGRDTVEGLRISSEPPAVKRDLQDGTKQFDNAVAAYKRDGNLDVVKQRVNVPADVEQLIKEQATA
jgi:hypothetical protein